MNLAKKKSLAAKTLSVSPARITFNKLRLDEIKEAITKQDIRDLQSSKAISVKAIRGKLKKTKRKTRRRIGSIKRTPSTRKRDYITMTRKLRNYLKELKKQDKITPEQFEKIRKEIRSRNFRSKAQLKERIEK